MRLFYLFSWVIFLSLIWKAYHDGSLDPYLHKKKPVSPVQQKIALENEEWETLYEEFGTTPLNRSSALGDLDVVRELAYSGANINEKNCFGTSPLLSAVCNRHTELAHFLLSNGAKIQEPDHFGVTPLMCAAATGNVALVNTLLNQGARIDARNSAGQTALFFAVKEGKASTVKALLARGAASSVLDRTGQSPFLLAYQNQNKDIMHILKPLKKKTYKTYRVGANRFKGKGKRTTW